MQKNILKIALASLTTPPHTLGGWEEMIREKLGTLPEDFNAIIGLASSLASGLSANGESVGGDAFELHSIFDLLGKSDNETKSQVAHYYSPEALSLRESCIFPIKRQSQTRPDLSQLKQELTDLASTSFGATEPFAEEVLSALHRLASNIPSYRLANVPLYDHLRITSALAICLLDQKEKNGGKLPDAPPESVALLVGGDISGIQEFIYTITAKGAAKSLRGRSFYLQLLTEAILRYVLRDLEIPYTNVIYSGGGHFFLLAPVSKAGQLVELQINITHTLLKHHRNSLYLALGYAEVPVSGFKDGRFPEYWSKMHAALARQKHKRYSELGAEVYKEVFAPRDFGGNPDETCSVCKEDHRETRKWDDLDIQERICTLCDSFIEEIGRKLPKSGFIALGFDEPKSTNINHASDALAEFGMQFQFLKDERDKVEIKAGKVVLWALDDPENGQWPSSAQTPKWLRYTANHVPLDQFDDLQKAVAGGFERLGVLRMDVDNLGELFKRGLGRNATLSQLATLSFRVSLFFEGWLKVLCEKEERKGKIYTVYAGGDDLFLIGPWDLMPSLAQEIVRDFAKYTGGNPDVHVSAGMAFIDGKYPVYQAAEDAKGAIDEAKSLDGKNAFTFLGKAWPWKTFESMAGKHERLARLVKAEEGKMAVPQAILQILQQLAVQEAQHGKKNGRHVWGRWIWMGMYQLTRMQELQKGRAQEIEAISKELHDSEYQHINQWGTAARWTELQQRRKKEEA